MTKRKKWLIIGIAIFLVVGLIVLFVILNSNKSPETKMQNTIRDGLGNNNVNLQDVLFEKDGWRYVKINDDSNPDNVALMILHLDSKGQYQIVMGPGTSFSLFDMTDAGVPTEVQAFVLNISVEDAQQQIDAYKNGNNPPPISFVGFDNLRQQGLSQFNMQLLQDLLSNYSQRRRQADNNVPYIRQITLNPDVSMAGENGEFIYQCNLVFDDKDQRRLDIYMDGTNMGNVVLMNSDGSNPVTLEVNND